MFLYLKCPKCGISVEVHLRPGEVVCKCGEMVKIDLEIENGTVDSEVIGVDDRTPTPTS